VRAEIAGRLVSDDVKQERKDAEIKLFEMVKKFCDAEIVAP
jgi:hypothetical protein